MAYTQIELRNDKYKNLRTLTLHIQQDGKMTLQDLGFSIIGHQEGGNRVIPLKHNPAIQAALDALEATIWVELRKLPDIIT